MVLPKPHLCWALFELFDIMGIRQKQKEKTHKNVRQPSSSAPSSRFQRVNNWYRTYVWGPGIPKGQILPPITLAERPARKYEAVQSLLKQIIVSTDDAPEPEGDNPDSAIGKAIFKIEPTDAKDVAERGFGLAQ
ncbi:hypothetical protein B0H14DRAFT_2614411 [Mycena olivaceomarginata]|nr:hypothetical protein B0H14DRAFT_2614411 [Mycena olivaceomarginata]